MPMYQPRLGESTPAIRADAQNCEGDASGRTTKVGVPAYRLIVSREISKKMPKNRVSLTQEQTDIAIAVNDMRGTGGFALIAPMGVGKTRILGAVNRKRVQEKDENTGECVRQKTATFYVAANTAQATKQAKEIGAYNGCYPFTAARLTPLTKALAGDTAVTTTLTPTMFRKLCSVDHTKGVDETLTRLINAAINNGIKVIVVELDEMHKYYSKSGSTMPLYVQQLRKHLMDSSGIQLVVGGATATPLYDAPKADPRIAKYACQLLGLEVANCEDPKAVLDGACVKVDEQTSKAIMEQIKPLQTAVPDIFAPTQVKIPTNVMLNELTELVEDAQTLLLLLALKATDIEGDVGMHNAFRACLSKAVVQAAHDSNALESVLPLGGNDVCAVDRDGALGNPFKCRANALVVIDTLEGTTLMKELMETSAKDEDRRAMKTYDLAAKDPATFTEQLRGFHLATTDMKSGHPIGFIDRSQLESCNEFGKNCLSIVAIGHFTPYLLKQGVKRLCRPVPLEEGDLVPTGGYEAHHLACKWQDTLLAALTAKPGRKKRLPATLTKLVDDCENNVKAELKELFGDDEDDDDDETDAKMMRVETKAKQLHTIDLAKLFNPPHNLAKRYLELQMDDDDQYTFFENACACAKKYAKTKNHVDAKTKNHVDEAPHEGNELVKSSGSAESESDSLSDSE